MCMAGVHKPVRAPIAGQIGTGAHGRGDELGGRRFQAGLHVNEDTLKSLVGVRDGELDLQGNC
jgi:hypothetical protein